MYLRVAGYLSFCAVMWHWSDGYRISEELQEINNSPPNMFGPESPTNKAIDELIIEAMGGLEGALNRKRNNGAILVELDMLLSEEQYYSLYEQPNRNTLFRFKRKAIDIPSRRWTNGVIPYRFIQQHFSQTDQDMIRRAMTEWERYTCLRFKQATSSDNNIIVFTDKHACFSNVGMIGGEQEISLSSDGCRNAFSKNKLETIRVKDPMKGANIGKASILSFRDVEIVNKMYGCHVHQSVINALSVLTATSMKTADAFARTDYKNIKSVMRENLRADGTCAKMYPSDKCLKWSMNGDCLNNRAWMNNYCCGTCGTKTVKITGPILFYTK